MWIASRVIFYGHWSFYRGYLLRENKCTIQNTKEKHNAKQSERKPENWIRKEGIAFVWQCLRVFLSQSIAMYQAIVVGCPILYLHTLPSIRRPNIVSNPFDFQNIYTIILISWSADFVFFLRNQMCDLIFRCKKIHGNKYSTKFNEISILTLMRQLT